MSRVIPPLENEADTLVAMLGIGPPVLLDIKPPDMLTAVERELIVRRLAEITRKTAAIGITQRGRIHENRMGH